MTGRSDNNRSQDQGGHREVLSTKEGGGKGTTVGKRTGREAMMRAMSVLGNAKSNSHRKTHRVEPDGTDRKFMHLTRGGLRRESVGEVSRGRSSEESRGNPEGAKGRRVRNSAINRADFKRRARSHPKRTGTGNYGQFPEAAGSEGVGGIPSRSDPRVASPAVSEGKGAKRCTK